MTETCTIHCSKFPLSSQVIFISEIELLTSLYFHAILKFVNTGVNTGEDFLKDNCFYEANIKNRSPYQTNKTLCISTLKDLALREFHECLHSHKAQCFKYLNVNDCHNRIIEFRKSVNNLLFSIKNFI